MAEFQSHSFYHALLDAFAKPGCPHCRLIAEAAVKYLDIVLYEAVTAVDFRKKFRAARGFCPRHTRQVAEFKNAVGGSILYREVIGDALERLLTQGARGRIKAASGRCPACLEEERLTANFNEGITGHLHEEALRRAWRASDGLCVPHLEMLLPKAPSATRKVIVEIETPKLEALMARLDEFTRKSDYRYAHERVGDEGQGWLDAIAKAAGGAPEDV